MKVSDASETVPDVLSDVMSLSDASKAAFTATPSSCFLANRNKSSGVSDQSVKNESAGQHGYMSLSTSQQLSAETSAISYQGAESTGFSVSGDRKTIQHLVFNSRHLF